MHLFSTLRMQLAMILIIPLIGVLFFTQLKVRENLAQQAESEKVQGLVEISLAASNLVHELQKERGMSAGFIGSKGQQFGSKLNGQYDLVDSNFNTFKEKLQLVDRGAFDPTFNAAIDKAVDKVAELSSYRGEVKGMSVPLFDVLDHYTSVNSVFLSLIQDVPKFSTEQIINNTALTYSNFLQSKERAGVERAVLTNAFTRDVFTPQLYDLFQSVITLSDVYINMYKSTATPEQLAFYNNTVVGADVEEANRMRKVAVDNAAFGGFGVDPNTWFSVQTSKINQLKKVDNNLGGHLKALADDMNAAATSSLIFYSILSAAIAFASFGIGFYMAARILRQLGAEPNRLGEVMGRMANGDFSENLGEEEKVGVFEAVSSMQYQLRAQEQMTEEEFQKVVDSALQGDLAARVNEDGKKGAFKTLSTKMNQLIEVSQQVISDTVNVLGALSNGDLSQRIEKQYEGEFGRLKQYTNTTADTLANTLNDMTAVTSSLANGDLNCSVESKYPGVFGELTDNMNAVVDSLKNIVVDIQDSSKAVRGGAEGIAQGNMNLSSRTEQQAASLEQTASSMDEISTTVQQTASNAGRANELVQKAQVNAVEGGQVVRTAVDAMSAINESSQRISEIIGVIDEIAFQTNLLALNASVEAARAGEQGRGFAVVASEVRNLAGRSATAAKEIKDLIEDSVRKVQDGSRLVSDSGETLENIVGDIKGVTDIVGEIACAADEQSVGVSEVHRELEQLQRLTQQNAAMVEEAAAASAELGGQASGLDDSVSFFKLDSQACSAETFVERRSAARPWSGDSRPTPQAVPAPVEELKVAGSDMDDWQEF